MYNSDFIKEVQKATEGNAHFFICEKVEKPDEAIIKDILGEDYKIKDANYDKLFMDFILEHELFQKYSIRYLEVEGCWADYEQWYKIDERRYVLFCLPLSSKLSIDEFKQIGFDYARKNKAPGIVFNDYNRKIVQMIRFGRKEILEIAQEKFDLIRYLGYLYNYNLDTFYTPNNPKENNDCSEPSKDNGHFITPQEAFYNHDEMEFEKLNDKDFKGIFKNGIFSNYDNSCNFNEEIEIMRNSVAIIEYIKYPVQLLEINLHETCAGNIEMVQNSIKKAKEKTALPLKLITVRLYNDNHELKIISNLSEKNHIYFA